MKSLNAKVLLLGQSSVGKTSILHRRQDSEDFGRDVKSTIGAAFSQLTIKHDYTLLAMQIWDTAGQERYRSLVKMYYRNTVAAFLVYDITDKSSFDSLKSWNDELKKSVTDPVIVCVVGNKIDLEEKRAVDKKKGEDFAKSIGALFCETSALTNTGIIEAFEVVAKEIVERADGVTTTDGKTLEDDKKVKKKECGC